MATRVLASNVLANGLRTEFADTYSAIRNRQSDSRLAAVMDLSVPATNREHDFAYFEAAPHMEFWERGATIPTDAMDSVAFNVAVHEWGRRVPWSKFDRKDDQTQSLMDVARAAGTSAALLPERFFFDLLQSGTATLPSVITAPDGVGFFSATNGDGGARFGVTGGNVFDRSGVTAAAILTDFYTAINRFKGFEDGKGQPMLGDETLESGFVIIHPLGLTEAMETAFIQKRQGLSTSATAVTNIVHDSSRNVTLWPSPRLTDDNQWYIFLANPPKKATFFLDREGVQEFSALEGDNNSDSNRSTAEEYVQWEARSGAGIALPYGAIGVVDP